jgi:hypothetical protein
MWLFLPLLLFVFYVPQVIVGVLRFDNVPAYSLAGVMALGLITYLIVFQVLVRYFNGKFPFQSALNRFEINSGPAIIAISVGYFSLMAYALVTSEKIALWEVIKGSSVDDLAFAREALFKSRVGWEKGLIYANAIFSSALMPFAVAVCYIEKKPYRHALLFFFAASLAPTLEKALILKALFPLIFLGFNSYFPSKRVLQIALTAVVIVAANIIFSKMGQASYIAINDAQIQQLQEQKARMLKSNKSDTNTLIVGDEAGGVELSGIQKQLDYYLWAGTDLYKYNVFGDGQLQYVANRIFWIPYVTAFDWLGYFYEKLNGNYLLGRTSAVLSRIGGNPPFPMENEVFKYQFGESGPKTAAANATFLVDAFVNFGWMGVIVYAGLFALITWVVVVQANPAMQACYYYFALQVSMGGLSGVLFSNGLILLICLAFFIRPKQSLFQ